MYLFQNKKFMEYYSDIKNNMFEHSSNEIDELRACYAESSKSEWKDRYCILMHIYGI